MNESFYDNHVAIIRTIAHYDLEVPFHPPEAYPEFSGSKNSGKSGFNPIYDAVRSLLMALELDKDHMGRRNWNPLAELIVPGNKVFIKPNLVRENSGTGRDVNAVVTHASVIRPIVDYVHRALEGHGEIVIGDAPTAEADFHLVTNRNLLQPTVGYLKGLYQSATFDIKLMDLRYARGVEEEFPEYDPLGIEIDLGRQSFLDPLTDREMENLTYLYEDNSFMTKVHNRLAHKYRIARDFLESDVVIGVPKLKTHFKAGVTLNLKNLVGVVTNKAYVPHLRKGPPSRGGDELPDRCLTEKIVSAVRQHKNDWTRAGLYLCANLARDRIGFTRRVETRYRLVRPLRGCWEGNDTIWRVALDLNRIMVFAGKDGVMGSVPRRKAFCIIDGIVGGEKNGPLHGLERPAGILVGGHNPYAVDLAATRLMGFDHEKIPLMKNAGREGWLFHMGPVAVASNVPEWNIVDLCADYYVPMPDLDFLEPDPWHIRLRKTDRAGRGLRQE